jgi:MerR family transcriptional regulator/heat shock protein HspR
VKSEETIRSRQEEADRARRRDRDALDAALDDEQAPRYSVGQVAELLGVRPWFLRRLDAMGVVTPTRSDGDQRRYSREDIERLIDARALMREGVSAAGVRHVLALQDRVAQLEAALSGNRCEEPDLVRPACTEGRARGR